MSAPDGPPPGEVRTPDDLRRALVALKKSRGLTYDRIRRPARLPKSTISDAFTGKSVPTRETLTALLLACGVDRAGLEPWLEARDRAAGRPAAPGPAAVALRNPRDLGVHAAIEVDGAPGALPAYVGRDADPHLRAALRAASSAGGFILLVGASSVGKTRSAYEAARGELPDWTLVQPGSLADLDRIAGEPPADTVVWLDEIHGFIADGLDAPLVRRLTSAGRRTVLIGTLWPEHYLTYVAFADPRTPDGDPYKRERELLRHAHVVDIGPRLSGAETARAREKAAVDPRIAIALDSDAGLIQTLAAGPELVRRWQNAPSPYAHALITAAIDARRLGVAEPSAALLADAVPGYLSRPLRGDAPPDWFAASLAYATTRVHGATSPLGPVGREMGRVDGYRVADYLQHHALRTRAGQVLPPSLWRACLEHTADRRELLAVGCAAYDRAMPRTAGDFFRAAVRAGSAEALYTLISLLSEQGRGDAVEEAWRLGAAHGIPHARERLAALLEGEGRVADAEAVWREAGVDPGTAAEPLVGLLLRAGRLDDAWAEAARHPGDLTSAAWSQLAEASAAAGRLDDAARAWGAASDRPDAPSRRARILRELGDPDAAVAVLEESIARGNWQSRETLVGLLDGLDRTAEAVRVLEEGAAAGEFNCRHQLAAYLIHHGREAEAVELWTRALRRRPDAESWATVISLLEALEDDAALERILRWGRTRRLPGAGRALEELLRRTGREAEVIVECRAAVAAGDPFAWSRLCRLHQEAKRYGEALEIAEEAVRAGARISVDWPAGLDPDVLPADAVERVWRLAADAGNTGARSRLAELLRRQGRDEDAVEIWRAGYAAGEVSAQLNLVQILCSLGRRGEAIEIMKRDAEERAEAVTGLVNLLVEDGAVDEALGYLRAAARAGDVLAWRRSAELLVRRDRGEEALEVWREALDAGIPEARRALSDLLGELGRDDEAARVWRDALAAGVLGARRALADLLVAQGDIEGATELWREAVREGKPLARRELAQLLHRTGRVREAQHEWYTAITAGDPYARLGLYRLLREEGLHDRAVDLLRNGVRHPLDDRPGLEPDAERPAGSGEAAFGEPAAALGARSRVPNPRRTAPDRLRTRADG